MKKTLLIILILVSHMICAQNAVVTYQGLLKANGVLINSTVDFEVVYHFDASLFGSPIQTETFNSTTVVDGIFTLPLGSTTLLVPLEEMFRLTPDIWIGLVVNGEVQSPGQKINLTPYAVNSLSLDGREASEYALSTQITALINRINELENKTQFIDVVGTSMKITGANLSILSGSGATDGAINGLGNLVVGYNEPIVGAETLRSGSHNIIVGSEHSYSNYGGLVAGQKNTISGSFSSVTGGWQSIASGNHSSIGGGESNKSVGERSSITGGHYNITSGLYSVVVGGGNNSIIDGNEAYADYSVVVGGYRNTTGDGVDSNIGIHSVIVAGYNNNTKGDAAVVVGGLQNHADGSRAIVSGGRDNHANGNFSSISGGISNITTGASSSISGGSNRAVSGGGDWRAGSLFEDN